MKWLILLVVALFAVISAPAEASLFGKFNKHGLVKLPSHIKNSPSAKLTDPANVAKTEAIVKAYNKPSKGLSKPGAKQTPSKAALKKRFEAVAQIDAAANVGRPTKAGLQRRVLSGF